MIYLDNAATTFPKPEEVYEEMDRINRECAVNAGRGSYKKAQIAENLIEETKSMLRDIVNADSSAGVVFSPSATIALNQIINGLPVEDNDVIYVSPYEHNAVARTINEISKRKRVVVKQIPISKETLEIDIEKLKYEFSKNKPTYVFCTHVSNVTGYILPIQEIFRESKKYNCVNVVDASQSMGLVEINSKTLHADIIAFAGHKTIYGPFGIGGFINVTNVDLDVFITGGTGSDSLNLNMPDDLETKYEAASCNIVAVSGLNAALRKLDIDKLRGYENKLTEYLIKKLNEIDFVKMYLPENLEKHVGIISFNVENMMASDVGMILDEDFDIAVRTGYHCAPYIHEYLNDKNHAGTVRIGLGQFNTIDDIDALIEALNDLDE